MHLLDELRAANFPIEKIEAAVNDKWTAYLASLILRSPEIYESAFADWSHKSIMVHCEERFVLTTFKYALFDDFSPSGGCRNWHERAARELTQQLLDVIAYVPEGLQLHVLDAGKFRQARPGDPAYDFYFQLTHDGTLHSVAYTSPPNWAQELYLCRANFDAYRLVWHNDDNTRSAEYEWFRSQKCEIVNRETLRRRNENEASPRFTSSVATNGVTSDNSDLLSLALQVRTKYWGENFDQADRDTWTPQNVILGWIKSKNPTLSDFAARAIEKVACPIDRTPDRTKTVE
ncbi:MULTISPECIES: hypothetical protein [Pandoraea]|uniref:hypothetical protein n=1 Tax=Pandoraea TaxID=93217 RepID=UPI001F5C986A|nr:MULTISPECIES: hypothetical protein [Pandoraea]